jgi:hypothetical protein
MIQAMMHVIMSVQAMMKVTTMVVSVTIVRLIIINDLWDVKGVKKGL